MSQNILKQLEIEEAKIKQENERKIAEQRKKEEFLQNRSKCNYAILNNSNKDFSKFYYDIVAIIQRLKETKLMQDSIEIISDPDTILTLECKKLGGYHNDWYDIRRISFYSDNENELTYKCSYQGQSKSSGMSYEVDHYASIKEGREILNAYGTDQRLIRHTHVEFQYNINKISNIENVIDIIVSWLAQRREDITIQGNRDKRRLEKEKTFLFENSFKVLGIGLFVLLCQFIFNKFEVIYYDPSYLITKLYYILLSIGFVLFNFDRFKYVFGNE